MLACSPPFPLIIDFPDEGHDITAKDESGIIHALNHRSRVYHIRLWMPVPNLQRILMAMDWEFPTLEYLDIASPIKHDTILILPETFQASQLRYLVLKNFALPLRPSLLTTAAGLLTLSLRRIHPSASLRPNELLHLLLFMPQLTLLEISFHSPDQTSGLENQRFDAPTIVTLPNLRRFAFGGVVAYLEVLLCQITTPLIEILEIELFNEPIFSIRLPLILIISETRISGFNNAILTFYQESVSVRAYSHQWDGMRSFSMKVPCRGLDRQLVFAIQISGALQPLLSAMEYLALEYSGPEGHKEAGRTVWRQLLSPFRNVKTLRVPEGLVGELSRSLRSDGVEPPQELLPELKVLEYPAGKIDGDAFTPFINARQIAGCPVTLVRR